MVLPIRLLARLRPNVRSYWCDSSDTCGGYATVTDSKGLCDRSIESDGLTEIQPRPMPRRRLRARPLGWRPRRRFCWWSASWPAWRGRTWYPMAPTSSTCTCMSAARGCSNTRARCTTTSTPTRRPTSRCPSRIRRSRRSCSIRCTCCHSGSSRSSGSSVSSRRCTASCGSASGCWVLATVERRCCGPPSASGSSRCAARSTTARSMCCWCSWCCTRCTALDGGCRVYWSGSRQA